MIPSVSAAVASSSGSTQPRPIRGTSVAPYTRNDRHCFNIRFARWMSAGGTEAPPHANTLRLGNTEGVTTSPDVGLLATAKHSRIDILLWNYQDDDVQGPTAAVHIDLIGLPPGLARRARIAQVGRLEGNAFTVWQSMGSPADPSRQQIDRLIRESRLKWKKMTVSAKGSSGGSSLSLRLPSQGVALIELLE